jgi:hypothetical protein
MHNSQNTFDLTTMFLVYGSEGLTPNGSYANERADAVTREASEFALCMTVHV